MGEEENTASPIPSMVLIVFLCGATIIVTNKLSHKSDFITLDAKLPLWVWKSRMIIYDGNYYNYTNALSLNSISNAIR